jgi:hypothetical protein
MLFIRNGSFSRVRAPAFSLISDTNPVSDPIWLLKSVLAPNLTFVLEEVSVRSRRFKKVTVLLILTNIGTLVKNETSLV